MDLRTIKEFLKDSLKYIIIITIVLLTVIYVVSLQQVVGPSMNPGYQSGDVLILNKLYYRLYKPKRFDVVVVRFGDKQFIKRVIGLPGEHIKYDNNGMLYVDGKEVKEEFKKVDAIITEEDEKNGMTSFTLENLKSIKNPANDKCLVDEDNKIPEDCYLVIGDNRPNSEDGRVLGLIHKKDFIGKVGIRIWPLGRK